MLTLPRRFDFRDMSRQASLLVVTLIAVLVVIFPIIWMVFASMRPQEETLT